jgi:hypothetical protein
MDGVPSPVVPQPVPSTAPRVLLQLGAIAVVLAASPTRAFDLDRLLVPKELVLHLTAVLAGLFALRGVPRARSGWIDHALGAYLILGVVSAGGQKLPVRRGTPERPAT